MSRDSKERKKARKERNKSLRAKLLEPTGLPGRDRWQGEASFQLGKDPRTRLDLKWSGVKIPVADLTDIDGVKELTDLALVPADTQEPPD